VCGALARGCRLTFTYPKRPWTLNIERQGNRFRRAKLVAEWRQAFAQLAAESPRLAAIHVTAQPHLRHRGSMPDTGACIGAAKAAIDGLIDAGVIPDDGPSVVLSLRFLAPLVDGQDSLELIVEAA
jgi:hypothetical protein